jgi:hypothetical protein
MSAVGGRRSFSMRRFVFGASLPRTIPPKAAVLTGLASAALLATACWCHNARPVDPGSLSELKPGQPYAVAVRSDDSSIDLNFDEGSRYVLVIGSLGASEQLFSVECSSRKIPAISLRTAEPVVPCSDHPRKWADSGDRVEDRPATVQPSGRPVNTHGVVPVNFSAPGVMAVRDFQAKSNPPGSRTFALHVTDGSLDDPAQYATIHAKTIAEGRHVRVYLDDQQSASRLVPGLVANVVDLFDRDIIPRFQGLFGTYRDIDHDGRFAVLLSPWLARLQGGRTSVGGFVRGSDFQPFAGPPFGNHCDMMYVNSQTVPGPHLRTLLIHEYTHAVCFSRRSADDCGRPRFPEEEDWLNEAIAHCAESLFDGGWSNLDYRIARFLNDPAAYPLVVGDYYRAGLWRCHGCRGATYLFLRYCVERFGVETLTRLIANPACGTHNIELATGCSFDRLFRDWTLSLLDSQMQKGGPDAADDPHDPDRDAAIRPAPPRLAALDLYGPLGEWGLAGPRRQSWDVDQGPLRLTVKGTSAAYIEFFATGVLGARRIRLNGSAGSKLQISVVRLEDNRPQIEVQAAWAPNPGPALSGTPVEATGSMRSDKWLHAAVRVTRGDALTIQEIAVEKNTAQTHTSICFANNSLNEIECRVPMANAPGIRPGTSENRSTRPDGERMLGTYDLPAARFAADNLPVMVKVVAVDRQGRRTSAFAIVSPLKQPQPERLAQRVR